MAGLIPAVVLQMQNYFLILIASSAFVVMLAQERHTKHNWDYSEETGSTHWGDLSPEFEKCKVGHHQSPIDIRKPRKADLPLIQFSYKSSPLDIVDNGHTVMVNYAPGSFISVGKQKYELKQFHFHIPSEETVDGKRFDMSVHLVHADEQGNLAVVAVLLQEGEDNPLIRELWNDLPKQKEEEQFLERIEIDASHILPADRGYYTFSGSLTTPPCSEDVTWFVLKKPVMVSTAEIKQFSLAYRHNARPPQPLNDRVVLESR